jgi:hypothetical protein
MVPLPEHGSGRIWSTNSSRELPQHVGEDAAVEEIFELVDGIDPAARL